MKKLALTMTVALALCASMSASADSFDGSAELNTTMYGWYNVLTGGIFENGQTRNGTRGSGGVMYYTHDDPTIWTNPSYDYEAFQQWKMDGWFQETAGIALTMWNDTTKVYDNNGIEDGTSPANFYGDPNDPSQVTPGLYLGYSMSNNADWIYSGLFELDEETTITEISGYFAGTYFYPIEPHLGQGLFEYNVNIFSSAQDGSPTNTGGFNGDVFTSDSYGGYFTVEDTGVDRHYVAFSDSDNIYRLTYHLAEPLTLQAGSYFFSHDAQIVPEPATISLLGLGLAGLAARRIRRKK